MWWKERLKQAEERGELRSLPAIGGRRGPWVDLEGERLNLSSNDYLGLAHHPRLLRAAALALERWGVGSTGSRLMSGDLPPHRELESALARWKGTEAALVLGSGYLANLGLISAVGREAEAILLDRLCHASIIDGVRLCGRPFHRFRHNDLDHLEGLLRSISRPHRALVVVEGVYSMEGDVAPLAHLLGLRRRYGFLLMVDDAHGVGAVGRSGVGVVPRRWAGEVDLHVGTFGKALGGYGAFVACSREMRRFLINGMRPFIFSTAPPPAAAAAALEGLEVVEEEGWRRTRLARLATWFRREVEGRLGLRTPSRSHIVPVIMGDNRRAVEASRRLLERGYYCRAVRPPTVPPGTARLRISITAAMEEVDLQGLLESLEEVVDGR